MIDKTRWLSGGAALAVCAGLMSAGVQLAHAEQGADRAATASAVGPVMHALANIEQAPTSATLGESHPVIAALPPVSRPFVIDVVDDAPVMVRMPQLQKTRVVSKKKAQFFNTLRPIVMAENRRVARLRGELLELKQRRLRQPLDADAIAFLRSVADDYRVPDFDADNAGSWAELLSRVDEVPLDMALAQAANESAWGSSRFAQQGNNLFGQWCFSQGCGIVPKRREKGATHEVARFDTVNDSVRSYIHNLNTVSAYTKFRALRADARAQRAGLEGKKLVEGLSRYSERGLHYIKEIQAMIRVNRKYIYAATG